MTRIMQSTTGGGLIATGVVAPQFEGGARHYKTKGPLPGQVVYQAQAKARERKESNTEADHAPHAAAGSLIAMRVAVSFPLDCR